MKAWRSDVILVALGVLAACGSSSIETGTGGTSGCPAATPTSGAACSPAGLQCVYGACGQVSASCSGGTWQITTSNIACNLDAGAGDAADAVGDGGLGTCSPACGSGQVCEYPQPPGICPQLDSGICPEGCPGCPPAPPPVPSCKPAPASCNPPTCSCLVQTACGGCGGTCEVKNGQVVLACNGC